MKFYILYNYDNDSNAGYTGKERIEAETLEIALQKYNAFKIQLEKMARDIRMLGLERIDQEEIITKIL